MAVVCRLEIFKNLLALDAIHTSNSKRCGIRSRSYLKNLTGNKLRTINHILISFTYRKVQRSYSHFRDELV